MATVRIDCLIFGYRKIKMKPEDLSLATSLLLRGGIPSRFNSDGTFSVRERDFSKLSLLFLNKIEYEASDILGIYGIYKRTRHKGAILSAIIISVIMTVILSNTVWDVRISGNEKIPDSRIVYELSKCGFCVGDFWFKSDRSEIEAKLLADFPNLSWVNINRRGTVAYVTVIENDNNTSDGDKEKTGYANIVAEYDCVIEEITVKRGVAVVKAGDTVKKGDLLISGALPIESGGGFCYAEGKVVGRMSDTVSANVERVYTKKSVKSEKMSALSIKIFDFTLNIFKKYGNYTDECDIIEDVRTFSLFGKCKLPVEVVSAYMTEYTEEESCYSDADLVRICMYRLNAKTAARLSEADLVKLKTYGNFTEKGYTMYSDIVFTSEIGKALPFLSD